MIDKHRQRQRQRVPTPQGRVPNWVLVLVAGAFTAAALLAATLS